MSPKIIGPEYPDIPWQPKPAGANNSIIWRHSDNPIIDCNPQENIARIYNSAVVPFNGGYKEGPAGK